MHPHEEATIRAFIAAPRRTRWLQKLASSKHRKSFLDRLNHCRDIDDRYASALRSSTDAVAVLQSRGAPASCYVISDIAAIDGRELPLAEAVDQAEAGGFGTLSCCIPGRLAYYIDEAGSERRIMLDRTDA
jgi:hypothetical protein